MNDVIRVFPTPNNEPIWLLSDINDWQLLTYQSLNQYAQLCSPKQLFFCLVFWKSHVYRTVILTHSLIAQHNKHMHSLTLTWASQAEHCLMQTAEAETKCDTPSLTAS